MKRIHAVFVLLNSLLFLLPVKSFTDPGDVFALGVLYTSLNSPPLAGWNVNGGDPCTDLWQGIECAGPNVTAIRLSGLGMTGWLGYALDNFTGLLTLDLSNNNIGQMIPFQLPPRVQDVNLANNQFSEGLPYSTKELISLTSFNVSNNQIIGPVPDMFQDLTSLTNLDLSGNNFSGSLPPSMGTLNSVLTMHLQNNQLTGDISILGQLLQLQDLNIENNDFTGSIPPSLLSIPIFQSTGNQLDLSPAPSPSPSPLAFPPSPSPQVTPATPVLQQPSTDKQPIVSPPKVSPALSSILTNSRGNYWKPGRIAGVVVASALAILAGLLVVLFFCGRTLKSDKDEENQSVKSSWHHLVTQDKFSNEAFLQKTTLEKPLTPPPLEKHRHHGDFSSKIAASAFSVAELQAATNSFARENLIGEGTLGRVYRANLGDGKFVAVKKLDTTAQSVQNEDEFLKVVSTIARLRQNNVTELVGYCCEHSQRLLVYEYFGYGTLFEVLHSWDESNRTLTWNHRVKIALGAARALEYLHEVCQPPVVHRNFKSVNILLDESQNPHVSDCGLAALAPFGSERQVSTQMSISYGYSAPEYAMSGIYTSKSDVYSFGVVMLELLTGRKSIDSTRSRSEQSLVRWATPQLHDIDSLSRMVDPALKGIYPAKSLSRFADIVSSCVQPEPEFRPPMSEVVQSLVRLMQRASLSKSKLTADDGTEPPSDL